MKIRVNEKWYDELNDNGYIDVGLIGTIIEICDDGICGIQFDKYINGHGCENRGRVGYCWYLPNDCFEYIVDDEKITAPNTLRKAIIELISEYKEEADDYYEEFFHGDSEARQQAYKRVVGDLEKLLELY